MFGDGGCICVDCGVYCDIVCGSFVLIDYVDVVVVF